MVSTCMDCVGVWRECHGEARALKYIFQVFSTVIPFSMAKEKKLLKVKLFSMARGQPAKIICYFDSHKKLLKITLFSATFKNNIIFSNFYVAVKNSITFGRLVSKPPKLIMAAEKWSISRIEDGIVLNEMSVLEEMMVRSTRGECWDLESQRMGEKKSSETK
jgi:hypothetical protein